MPRCARIWPAWSGCRSADERWIEVVNDAPLPDLDVYFRVGDTFALAAIFTGRTDLGDALALSAVAGSVARR